MQHVGFIPECSTPDLTLFKAQLWVATFTCFAGSFGKNFFPASKVLFPYIYCVSFLAGAQTTSDAEVQRKPSWRLQVWAVKNGTGVPVP